MREGLIGFGLAAVTCIALALLPAYREREATAILLTLIAAIYIGFSLASAGRLGAGRQVAGCAVFIALALLGLWVHGLFLAAGLALHGGWDHLHRGEHGRGVVPRWYVPFCTVYDWTVALYVVIRYAALS